MKVIKLVLVVTLLVSIASALNVQLQAVPRNPSVGQDVVVTINLVNDAKERVVVQTTLVLPPGMTLISGRLYNVMMIEPLEAVSYRVVVRPVQSGMEIISATVRYKDSKGWHTLYLDMPIMVKPRKENSTTISPPVMIPIPVKVDVCMDDNATYLLRLNNPLSNPPVIVNLKVVGNVTWHLSRSSVFLLGGDSEEVRLEFSSNKSGLAKVKVLAQYSFLKGSSGSIEAILSAKFKQCYKAPVMVTIRAPSTACTSRPFTIVTIVKNIAKEKIKALVTLSTPPYLFIVGSNGVVQGDSVILKTVLLPSKEAKLRAKVIGLIPTNVKVRALIYYTNGEEGTVRASKTITLVRCG